ncbi:hypothetical protein Tco_0925734 [Tanacetum coccineum]|uniref:Uncharacterized protein n=1 Tax=Tanacetum coccineum TaxID=301880 RepID=A0ABQ5D7S9_9ASTR
MPRKSSIDYKNTRHYILKISHEFRSPIKEKLRNLKERFIHEGRVVFENFTDLNYVRSLFHFVEFECLLEVNKQGACIFSDRWSLNELVYGAPSEGPYQTNLPSPDDIISYVREDREGQVTRIRHQEEVEVQDYQILTREIVSTLKPLEEKGVTKKARLILPYGMLLTCLFDFIIGENPKLQNETYVLYDRVMNPLSAQLKRKPRRDRGTRRGRHSTSSSTFDQPSSSHLNDDDDDGNDEGTSRESTPSPIRYVNSLTNQFP